MNIADTKRLSETVSAAGSMVLFLIFTVCCLVIITVAATAYKRISENYDNTFNSAAAVRYVTNKLRSCDSAEITENGDILMESVGIKTLIYERDGVLYERLFSADSEAVPEGGEAVFSAEGFEVEDCGGLAKISAIGAEGEKFTAYCRVSSVTGGG
ncbi:MAG: DUF4860 domain-containing protein, partial [Oscillospiraceae bacterium]|nr:DUF4860 domain-containing protein [Oscillospiraceae bacterium]